MFLILLVLRLDNKSSWNWFIIFIPLWFFDIIVVVYVLFNVITHCKNRYDRNDLSMDRKFWYLAMVSLKIVFQILICRKLQYAHTMPLYQVMIPILILLTALVGDVFVGLVNR